MRLALCVSAVLAATTVVALVTETAEAGNQYTGALGSPAVDPAFAAATATHVKECIDFDNDGFVLAPHTFTPIPPNHYSAQGVTLLNLDARSVGDEPWAHSPPIGAWHTGFSSPITEPYSFVFARPIASFGMFANDVEAAITTTVHLTTANEIFVIPFQGSANIGQFHGFAAGSNVIQRIDFATSDYHVIDDIQFGYVPEPSTAVLLSMGTLTLIIGWWRRRPRCDPHRAAR